MGELAVPSAVDRARIRSLASAWLSSIASDSSPPSLTEFGGLEGFVTAVLS